MNNITIIGGGLAGSLLALALSKQGYHIDVFESRSDLRDSAQDFGRSINMALSCRGITSLDALGLMPKITPIMVPMRSRAIYELDGSVKTQAFGRHADEYINAIKRSDLNRLLLDCIDNTPSISLYFNHSLVDIDFQNRHCLFTHANHQTISHHYELLIGADGASSKVRDCLHHAGHIKATRRFLPHGYKELSICSPEQSPLLKEHLHMWPRDRFMLLGNPNPDNSVTGSIFLPNKGPQSFAELDSEVAVRQFFSTQFPDIYPQMPNLAEEFFNNPQGNLSTVKCTPWYYPYHCLLLGDAAHAVVPFFGQGMNAAFEDCRILSELMAQHKGDCSIVIPAFYQLRKPNTDAVAAMSMDNYHEIRHEVRDQKFLLRKALELELMQRYPNHYISRHIMVMFTNFPYQAAYNQGKAQLHQIDRLCENKSSLQDINWEEVDALVHSNALNTYQLIEKNSPGNLP